MKLVTSREKYAKYVMRRLFKDVHTFLKEVFTVEIKILDLSKTLMYGFHMTPWSASMEIRKSYAIWTQAALCMR